MQMYLSINNRKQVYCQISQLKQYQIQFKMDYEALANILPKPPKTWNQHQVHKWLQFVHLQALSPIFAHHINGPHLLNINLQQLQAIGITNSIIQRKLVRWIKEGLVQFQHHLKTHDIENKENIPPLQKKTTTERQTIYPNKQRPISFVPQEEGSMIVRSCDGNLAAFYVMGEKSLNIGRLNTNTIRTLEVSVANEHAEIFKANTHYYIRDKGSKAGTFIKIVHPKKLSQGTLVEMGSFMIEVMKVDRQTKMITLEITHMVSQGNCQVIIALQDGCSFYSFGRRKTNNFSFDDQHLSGMHARIFLLHGDFVIEDLHSTNGTWLRLSKPSELSNSFLLQNECIFKIGTTITYQCEGSKVKEQKMDIEYDDGCIQCGKQKKNILLLPCRHNIVCSNCAQGMSQCIMCKSNIEEKIKMYI